jgi:hypothetical protein
MKRTEGFNIMSAGEADPQLKYPWQNPVIDALTEFNPKWLPAKVSAAQRAISALVARILVVEVALEKPFFSWDHNRRDEADSWNERYEQPKVIQPN